MKKFILTSLTLLSIVSSVFSQNFYYAINGIYTRPIIKEKISSASSLADFIPDYPKNWIEGYESVEISTTYNGKTKTAISKNDVLNNEQKTLLNSAQLTSDIVVNVKYKQTNCVMNKVMDNTMNISFTVVPEVEAEFVGGKFQLRNYLSERGVDALLNKLPKEFKGFIVKFTIDEKGKVRDAIISKTSGSEKIDKMLLDAINKMPTWKPAQDANGIKVKQEFEFNVGAGVDGC